MSLPSTLGARLVATARQFPVELAECLFILLFCELDAARVGGLGAHWLSSAAFMPIVLALSFSLGRLTRGCPAGRYIYYGSVVTVLPLLVLDTHRYVDTPGYYFGLLLALLLILLSDRRGDNTSFALHALATAYHLAAGAIIAGVAWMAIAAITESVHYIFGADTDPLLKHFAYVTFSLLPAMSFCVLQGRWEQGDTSKYDTATAILSRYIVSPAVIIYTAVLYIYLIDILLLGTLPRGGVAALILAYFIVAMACHAFNTVVPCRLYGWFFKRFHLISLPLLGLYWWGLGYRIAQYSLTEMRCYLAVAGALMVAITVMLAVRRLNRYRLMAYAACALIALTTYVPGISARAIARHCQLSRLERLISDGHLLDPATGHFRRDISAITGNKQDTKLYRQAYDCYYYLSRNDSTITKRYGEMVRYTGTETTTVSDSDSFWLDSDLDLGKYTIRRNMPVTGDWLTVESTGDVIVTDGDRVLLRGHLDRKTIDAAKGSGTLPAEAHTVRNDSLLLVLGQISRDTQAGKPTTYSADYDYAEVYATPEP